MSDQRFLTELQARCNAGEALELQFFWGHRPSPRGVSVACFSQWYDAPFVVDSERFATAEHYMMVQKAELFGDLKIRPQILAAATPGAAKALGRKVKDFDEVRWIDERFAIVCRANRAKFSQHADLGRFLLHTGSRVLVEASPVDMVWGIGLAQDDAQARDPNQWRGLNLLGFALMQVRTELGSKAR